METALGEQAAALSVALLMGAGCGIIYDMLRPVRRLGKAGLAAASDIIYSICAGVVLFAYAMSSGDGRLGLWELAAALLGFLAYMYTLSDGFVQIFSALLNMIIRAMEKFKKITVKLAFSAKYIFQKMRECFIIKK